MSKNLIVLVGLPGSGKTTWANNFCSDFNIVHLSSDEYRKKISGDENDQTHNAEVFSRLYSDMVTELNSGNSVCIDATNIKESDRNKIIYIVKTAAINCNIIALVFNQDINICKDRNLNRDRVVPEDVIDRMSRNFIMPTYDEGFNSIYLVSEYNNGYAYSKIIEE